MLPPKSFVSGNGKYGGYEVWGWRYSDTSAWHVKVWPEFDGVAENAYVVTDGIFEPLTVTMEEKVAVLSLIARWEAESSAR
jgi:hypothetical protein